MSITTANLGFPRIGRRRELKAALESYWAGKSPAAALLDTAASLRQENWLLQQKSGLDHIPSNDFSLYDQMLDMSALVGAIPKIYERPASGVPLDLYFAMARGSGEARTCAHGHQHETTGVPALEMTKWFDTNYHYMVPELASDQAFELITTKPLDDFREAKALGIHTRPVLVGPVTYLLLAKVKDGGAEPLSLLPGLLPVYVEILRKLAGAGAAWVQIDEPALVLDLSPVAKAAFKSVYETLVRDVPGLKLMLTTYFGALGDNADLALKLPVAGLHVDLCAAPEQADIVLAKARADLTLSLGVVNGRNIWRNDLSATLRSLDRFADHAGGIVIAPSSSLLHVPVDLALETDLDPEVRSWLAFATQKIARTGARSARAPEGRRGAPSVKAEAGRSPMNRLRSRSP
jgi:5-methyltetrahydropteroyltriglutamate--homocysteine methyltransferase